MTLSANVMIILLLIAVFAVSPIYSCEQTERRKVPVSDRCNEECGMYDVGVKCTNTGCYKPQRWSCRYKCHKSPPIEVEVHKCCPGYEKNEKGLCVDVDECSDLSKIPGCYGCVNTAGSYKCTRGLCTRGYKPAPDGSGGCVDIDECRTGKAQCSGVCVNTPGSYYCQCPPGFQLAADNRTCEDVDECANGRASCSDICLNTYGGYQCGCEPGYEISLIGGLHCVDIDECNGIHKCSHECHNINGSYYCSCPDNTVLGRDLRNCLDYSTEDRCALVVAVASLSMALMTTVFVVDKLKQYRRSQQNGVDSDDVASNDDDNNEQDDVISPDNNSNHHDISVINIPATDDAIPNNDTSEIMMMANNDTMQTPPITLPLSPSSLLSRHIAEQQQSAISSGRNSNNQDTAINNDTNNVCNSKAASDRLLRRISSFRSILGQMTLLCSKSSNDVRSDSCTCQNAVTHPIKLDLKTTAV